MPRTAGRTVPQHHRGARHGDDRPTGPTSGAGLGLAEDGQRATPQAGRARGRGPARGHAGGGRRFSTSSAATTWRGVTPTALSVPIWRVCAAIRPATITALVVASRPTRMAGAQRAGEDVDVGVGVGPPLPPGLQEGDHLDAACTSRSRWAATKAAASSGSSSRSSLSKPSSVSRAAHGLAGGRRDPDLRRRLSGKRPRSRSWPRPHLQVRPFDGDLSPARRQRVGQPVLETTPSPRPSHGPSVTSGWSTGEGGVADLGGEVLGAAAATSYQPYRWVHGPPTAGRPGPRPARGRGAAAATRSASPGSSGGW